MINQEICIAADVRTQFKKGANRKLRNSESIPAVLYQKSANMSLTIALKALPKGHTGSDAVKLAVGGVTHTVLMREVQTDPLTGTPIHIDFQEVTENQVVLVKVPVEYVGITKEQEKDCAFRVLMRSVALTGPVSKFPSKIQINVASLQPDQTLHLEPENIPAGLKIKAARKLALAALIRK